jgi:hypothetical protein
MSVSLINGQIYWEGRPLPPEMEPRLIDGKLWARCCKCHRYIRLNKPLLGSHHVCIKEGP